MLPDPTKNGQEPIDGWLAIAAYLRVEKTTAQRWERHGGLPVHRLPGKRGGVYARAGELDQWRRANEREHAAAAAAEGPPAVETPPDATPMETGSVEFPPPADTSAAETPVAPPPEASPADGPRPTGGAARAPRIEFEGGVLTLRLAFPRKWWWADGVALAALLAWAAVAWLPPARPAAFRMEGSTLVAMNASGRELWRHSFPASARTEAPQSGLGAWMGELVRGEPFRALFPLQPAEGGAQAELYCLDSRGSAEWEFLPPAGFEVEAFHTFAAKQRDQSRVVVSSADPWGTANQVAALDGHGRLTGQYWHGGKLGFVADANLDREDTVDVLLSGVDEAHKQATMVGFDRNRIDRRAMPNVVVLFPRSCVAETLGPYNRACEMVWRGGVLRVVVREGPSPNSPPLIYEFDQGLKPLRVALSGEYLERRRELEAEGRLNHSCEGEAERLAGSVRVTWRGTLAQ